MFRSLYARLSAALVVFLGLFGAVTLTITERNARAHFLEFTQHLNAPIARYMADFAQLPDGVGLDAKSLADLAPHVMMVNPSVEVYLLDNEGRVTAQAAESNTIAERRVDVAPIKAFIDGSKPYPLLGQNPMDANDLRVFSAHPLINDGVQTGFVYAVLGHEQQGVVPEALRTSYSLRNLMATLLFVLVFGLLGGLLLFFLLTRRLRALTRRVRQFQPLGAGGADMPHLDEVDNLALAYDTMAEQLTEQNHQLRLRDRGRREFVAAIAHDLRTPLTTLQGYLETLSLKGRDFTEEQRRQCIATALKHSERLRALVSQLFEYSALNAPDFQLHCERFSLLELAHDIRQDFLPQTDAKSIRLDVHAVDCGPVCLIVQADIALVTRVFENLLSNAIRFVPAGGRIRIDLSLSESGQVVTEIRDTGTGMQAAIRDELSNTDTITMVSTREQARSDHREHMGLGLAIVKRIITLHHCRIWADAESCQGTCIRFELPVSSVDSIPATLTENTGFGTGLSEGRRSRESEMMM